MKERILKLCRRLKSCTLDDLIQLTETDKETISLNILYLSPDLMPSKTISPILYVRREPSIK
jgi:hypothetical protein